MNSSWTVPNISILVPVFNAEKTIIKCLDSILKQSYPDIEIICINDGSTDNTLNILHDYSLKDARILLIDKPNSGYGDSLNKAISLARGKYIGIVESDDYIDLAMYENLTGIAEKHNAEVVKSDFYNVYDDFVSKANIVPMGDADRLISPIYTPAILKAQPSIWSAIYLKDYLQRAGIYFTDSPGAAFQDTAFNLKALTLSDKIWLTDTAYVYYQRGRDESSINSSDKMYAVVDEYREYEKFMQRHKDRLHVIRYTLTLLKFETYSWNLSRLRESDRGEFYAYMHKEFTMLNKKKEIRRSDFCSQDAKLLDMLLRDDKNFIKRSIEQRRRKYAHNDL